MTSTRVSSMVVLVSLLGLAACGSSAKKVDPAADLALAKRAVLAKADMLGYTGIPHKQSDDARTANDKQFASCLGVPSTIFDDRPGAQIASSPDFSKGRDRVLNDVEIEPKQSDVDNDWKQFSKPGVAPCIEKYFGAGLKADLDLPKGLAFGSTSIEHFDVGVGKRSLGYGLTFSVESKAASVTFYIDFVVVVRDRAEVTLSFFNVPAPMNRTIESLLAQKVYDRIGDNAK